MNTGYALLSRPARALCAGGAVAAATLTSTALVVLFADASRAPWLASTASNEQRMQACAPLSGRARESCVARVVAEVTARRALMASR